MADGDAEWIDVDKEFGRPLTPVPGPNKPRPRPTTARPRRTTSKMAPEDAPEKVDPNSEYSSNATIISVSVVSSIAIVGLILVLLYMFLLKKKLKKVEKSKIDSDYSLRVEDVAHLDIDESASLYVNTTDLQKLVSTMRIKNKGRPPAIPNENNPEVVRIEKPAYSNNINVQEESTRNHHAPPIEYGHPRTRPKIEPPAAPRVKPNFNVPDTLKVVRAAPPPPTQDNLYSNQNFESEDSFDELETFQNEISPTSLIAKNQTMSAPPDNYSKSKILINHPKPNNLFSESKPEPPPVQAKPKLILNSPKKQSPPPVSLKPKPQLNKLPLLKTNLLPSMNRQDSGVSTPGTASTYFSDSSQEKILENGVDNDDEPTNMSVTARKALLEQAMAAAESHNRS